MTYAALQTIQYFSSTGSLNTRIGLKLDAAHVHACGDLIWPCVHNTAFNSYMYNKVQIICDPLSQDP